MVWPRAAFYFFVCLGFACCGATMAPSQSGSPTGLAGAAGDDAAIQAEVGDRDRTYLRTRAVFRYDYKVQDGSIETNRFRLKLLYGFGPRRRLGVSVNLPVIHKEGPADSAFGLGDVDVTFGGNFYRTKKFRAGLAGQVTFQTAIEHLLGGSSTNLKGSWGFTYVANRRFEITAAFSYKQSIHIEQGRPTKQFEPDITLNARFLRATWFIQSDSYYDFIPSRYAPMLKTGLGRSFGKGNRWAASAYTEFPLNAYARLTQNHVNVGLDMTWYPFAER